MDRPDWVDRARYVANPVLEVGFTVWEDLYYGPANDFSPEQWQTLREPLYQPGLELYPGSVRHVLTPVLEGSEGELVRYYHDVLRLAKKHAVEVPRSHFWLTPFLFAADDVTIQFGWHDTRDDAERVFAALETSSDGSIYDDTEQGWELDMRAQGNRLFIRHDNEDGEEFACLWCDRDALVRQVAPLRERLDRILAELRTALGADYWSRDGEE